MSEQSKRREGNIEWAKERLVQTNAYLHEMMKVLGMRLVVGNAAGIAAVLGALSKAEDFELYNTKILIGKVVFAVFSIGLIGGFSALDLLMYFLKGEREWRVKRLQKVLENSAEELEFEENPPKMAAWSKFIGAATTIGLAGLIAGLGLSIWGMFAI